jgi:fructose-bisphosphate aldolase, class I
LTLARADPNTPEIRGLCDGGANGSIIGRNAFQRPRDQALDMLDKIIGIYQGKM